MPRSLWSGTITFGLVTIPIKIFSAVQDKSVHFHMLNPEGTCRLRRKLYCPETNKEYDFSETARGYEIAPDQYVLIDENEIKKLKPEKGENLVIQQFLNVEEIDPIFFDKPYYLGPGKGGGRAYRLLLDTLEDSQKVAIGQFVMRNKQHYVVLRSYNGALMIHTLNYAEEIVDVSQIPGIDAEEDIKVSAQEKKMAKQLLDSMTAEFHPEEYEDEFKEAILEVVAKAKKGKTIKVAATGEEKQPSNVLNLMDALKKSLDTDQEKRQKRSKTNRKKAAH